MIMVKAVLLREFWNNEYLVLMLRVVVQNTI